MKIILTAFLLTIIFVHVNAQLPTFTTVTKNGYTSIKNQQTTGTCWCFSTTSLIESQSMLNGVKDVDLSEMFTVRNIYVEKAKNYILRQGAAQFGEGGLGHDVVRAISLYGTMPEATFSGNKLNGRYDHSYLAASLKLYLDSVLTIKPITIDWLTHFNYMLDTAIGKPPATFDYKGKQLTPQQYAADVLKFNADDYVSITSFTHHPYYKQFILEAPDNFANGSFYNLPLDEMINVVKTAVGKGFTVMWDADVSNRGFNQSKGYALNLDNGIEKNYSVEERQALYENLTTQDDHLMHLIGIEKDNNGKEYFLVKNSWGEVGPYKGLIDISIPYFAINTVSLVVPKAALSKEVKAKLGIK